MDAASNQIRDLHANAGAAERQNIRQQLRDLQRDLYSDWELLFGTASGTFQWALIQIGLDLGIFTTLSQSPTAVTHEELVQKTGAAPKLLIHFLRAMASLGLIAEAGKESFQANRLTHSFANPHVVGAAPHLTGMHFPIHRVLPEFLRDHKYQDLTNTEDLPFHRAMKTDLSPFEWMKQDGTQMKAMGHALVIDAAGSWVDSYPVEKELGHFEAAQESAVLVDVGGGFGQHSVAFQKKLTNVPGRIVVQDIPATLKHARSIDGIEFQEHDFFTPQPIKGAKFYYMRHIMHDWTDLDCIRILQNLTLAMGPESRILIDEVIMPASNVPWAVAFMDITMLSSFGGLERTRDEWEALLDQAGLKIVDIHTYDEVRFHSIIAAVPK